MTTTVSPPAEQTPAPPVERGLGVWSLRALVVVAGMTTMATEMSASRMLQPFFGASIIVWANVIGLILIYLSVGYWWGGRVADRHPHARGLCTVTLSAAITIALLPFVAKPVLGATASGFDTVSTGTLVGSFIGSLLLLSVPITMLGMVPPYAVRLAMSSVDSSGRVSGSLYSLSTIGSMPGTFGSVLVLIPLIGTRRTFLVFAIALALLSLLGLRGRRRAFLIGAGAVLVMVVLLTISGGAVKEASAGDRVIFEKDGLYQYVQVVEEENGRRLLQLNEGWAIHSVYDPETVLTDNIWDHFLVLGDLSATVQPDIVRNAKTRSYEIAPGKVVTPTYTTVGSARRMLVVGNAAGSAARIYRKYRPEVSIDGVEIDPLVSDVGSKYFGMDGKNLDVHHADGRPFLQSSNEKWDVILIDAYKQPYIPFYLTTREFFELVNDHLEPGGVIGINVGSAPDDNRIQEAVGATMRDVFPSVMRYQAEEYNEVIVAFPERVTPGQAADRILSSELAKESELKDLFEDFAHGLKPVEPSPDEVLTDDHAPVEWMTDKMIFDEAQRRS